MTTKHFVTLRWFLPEGQLIMYFDSRSVGVAFAKGKPFPGSGWSWGMACGSKVRLARKRPAALFAHLPAVGLGSRSWEACAPPPSSAQTTPNWGGRGGAEKDAPIWRWGEQCDRSCSSRGRYPRICHPNQSAGSKRILSHSEPAWTTSRSRASQQS